MWIPSRKNIDPNEFVSKLAKEALDAEQPDFVSYSMAYSCVKGGLTCRFHPPHVQETCQELLEARLKSTCTHTYGVWTRGT